MQSEVDSTGTERSCPLGAGQSPRNSAASEEHVLDRYQECDRQEQMEPYPVTSAVMVQRHASQRAYASAVQADSSMDCPLGWLDFTDIRSPPVLVVPKKHRLNAVCGHPPVLCRCPEAPSFHRFLGGLDRSIGNWCASWKERCRMKRPVCPNQIRVCFRR